MKSHMLRKTYRSLLLLLALTGAIAACSAEIPAEVAQFHETAMQGPVPLDSCQLAGGAVVSLALIDFGPGAFRDARPQGLAYQYEFVADLEPGLIEIEDGAGRRFFAVGYGVAGPRSGLSQEHYMSACAWPQQY